MKQLFLLTILFASALISYADQTPPKQFVNSDYLILFGDSAFIQNNLTEAISYYEQALVTQEDNKELIYKLASCYCKQHECDKALHLLKQISNKFPLDTEIYKTIGALSGQLMQIDDAIDAFTHLLKLNPLQKEVVLDLGRAYLFKGDRENGWKFCKLYYKLAQEKTAPFWNGQSLENKTIFIADDSGIGDLMNWIRYTTLFKNRGARVICGVRTSMIPLISRCAAIDSIIADGQTVPPHDFYILASSAPYLFDSAQNAIPAQVPYLYADQQLVAQWKNKLKTDKNFKIGICWEGQTYINQTTQQPVVNARSIPLATLMQLAQPEKISLYSLQQVNGLEQIDQLPKNCLKTFSSNFDKKDGAFSDTATVIKNLDLVITIDSAIAHLAGGLGVPVWVLLPFNCDSRWSLNRSDTIWYPTMKLFRQPTPGDWQTPMRQVINQLQTIINK